VKRFGQVLLGGYALVIAGTLLVFLAPKFFAPKLITPLWAFSIFLVLATWAYVAMRAVLMVRRWINKPKAP